MPNKDDLKKIVSSALDGVASSIFINHTLAVIDESADSRESLMAGADRIRNRVALFIDENLAGKMFAVMVSEIGKMDLIPGTRRRHVRVGFRNKVNVTHAGKIHELYTSNISEGGMHLEIKEPFPVGSKVEISFPLKGDSSVVISGVVVNSKRSKGLQPAGMGIRFDGVSDLVLTILKSIINRASDHAGSDGPKTRHAPADKSGARP